MMLKNKLLYIVIATIVIISMVFFFLPLKTSYGVKVSGEYTLDGLQNCLVEVKTIKEPLYKIVAQSQNNEKTYVGVWNQEGREKYVYRKDSTINLQVVSWKYDEYTGEPILLSLNYNVNSILVYYNERWELPYFDELNESQLKKIAVISVENAVCSYKLKNVGWYVFVPIATSDEIGDYSIQPIRCIPKDMPSIMISIRVSGYLPASDSPTYKYKYLYFDATEGKFDTFIPLNKQLSNILVDIWLFYNGEEIDRESLWIG